MKRCPECRRDYYDDSLIYCLDDGVHLLEGPVTTDEARTAILSQVGGSGQAANPHSRRIIVAVLGVLIVTALGAGTYVYYARHDSSQIESIAVMPFLNESGNTE